MKRLHQRKTFSVKDAVNPLMNVIADAHTAGRLRSAAAAVDRTPLPEDKRPTITHTAVTEVFRDDFTWMAGGPQGSGVDSAANIYGRACCFGGLHVYGKREYHSNIKGLHSYFHIRVSNREVMADAERVDLLCAFDAETIVRHIWEVTRNGGIVCDTAVLETRLSEIPTLPPRFWADFEKELVERSMRPQSVSDLLREAEKNEVHVFPMPYHDLLKDVALRLGEERLSRVTRMLNVLALGASFALVDYDRTYAERAIEAVFKGRRRIIDMNLLAFSLAYDYAEKNLGNLGFKLEPVHTTEKRVFLQGTQAVALGKLVAGCRVQTYYPITPAADESEYLEENQLLETLSKRGGDAIVVMQTEDEVAAINMASGAALTGVRAATSTSGPGFSLMVEGLGWAGNNEVPVVVTHYQRAGPGTGMATRHGQSDLRFVLHAAHGEFPRIVLSSGDLEECFYDAAQSFNLAERYQMPVIHLIDKALANSSKSYRMFDPQRVKVERGLLLSGAEVEKEAYRRFAFTGSGVSPRLPLGTPGAVSWNTGYEHDELGHICEESINRTLMVEKRMKKLEAVEREVPIEEKVNFYGDHEAATSVVSWGSPKGAVIEAVDKLRGEGYGINFVQVRMVHPLPKDYLSKLLAGARRKVVVEGNYNAQLAGVIAEQTGVFMDYYVLKWSGRPMYVDEVYEALKLVMWDKASRRQVLTGGG